MRISILCVLAVCLDMKVSEWIDVSLSLIVLLEVYAFSFKTAFAQKHLRLYPLKEVQ